MASRDDMMRELLYGDMLTTPSYDVDFAVGTTYSLNFKALLIVPYSLGMFGDLSDNVKRSPLFLLESIRRCSDHFALFCHRGGIHLPHEAQSYYSLLEDSIFEVSNQQNPEANFHPKIWVIKEHHHETPNDKQLKVVVMSKNLGLDNNLDMAVSMTGKINTDHSKNTRHHGPLKDFLYALANYAKDAKKRKRILEVADDLLRVKAFELDDTRFEPDGYEFIPFWFGKCLNKRIKFPNDFQAQSVMVISPFIDDNTLTQMNMQVKEYGTKTLVTRAEYVSPAIYEQYAAENGSIYVMNDQMKTNDYHPIDLHAKTYFFSNSRNDNRLLIGSANATNAAFHRNTEFLLSLKLRSGNGLLNRFRKEFLQMDDNDESLMYEPVTTSQGAYEEHGRSELEKYMCKVVCGTFTANAEPDRNEHYRITINTDIPTSKVPITIAPLQMPTIALPLRDMIMFEHIPLTKLSQFYILTAHQDKELWQEVIKIPTAGIPNERNDEIFRGIVNTKEKFYNYISFMLCDDPEEYIFELEQAAKILKQNQSNTTVVMPQRIYEQMLKMAAKNPAGLERLEDVTRIVNDKDYAQEFNALYSQFKPLIAKLKQLL